MRLSVLHVGAFPFPAPFGSQVYAAGCARAVARRGHRVRLACFGEGEGTPPSDLPLVRGRAFGGGVHTGPGWRRPLQDLELARVVRRALGRGDVDLVHAHNVEGPVLAALGGLHGVPVVWTPHTRMADELPSWLPGRPQALRAVGWSLDRLARRMSDAAVVLRPGADVADGLDVEVVPPGIDPADFEGADAERGRALAGDGPFVAYAGNTDRYQDLPDLFAAVDRAGARLAIVTADASGVPRAAARDLRVVASRSWADTRDVLAAAAVAVVPRRLDAGFPMKLLNQVGLGVPTVVTDGATAPIDGLFVVPAGDTAAMARVIRRILDDPATAREQAARARAEVLTAWTWDVRGAQLEAFYSRLLGRRTQVTQPPFGEGGWAR